MTAVLTARVWLDRHDPAPRAPDRAGLDPVDVAQRISDLDLLLKTAPPDQAAADR